MDQQEFRIELIPAPTADTGWTVRVLQMPNGGSLTPTETVRPQFDSAALTRLRRPTWMSNAELLRGLGESVWNLLFAGQIRIAFEMAHNAAGQAPGTMRFVLVLREPHRHDGQDLRLGEIPFEALFYSNQQRFLALDQPLSRALPNVPELPPSTVARPIKVLIAVATPAGKPQAEATNERQRITAALAPQVAANAVELHFCADGTVDELHARLGAVQPHVLHFIGHGDVGFVGGDPTPQPYLCFEQPGPGREVDHVTAGRLLSILRDAPSVRLAVLSACSTADETHPGEAPTTAFTGLAQRIILNGMVGAVVAMQFDLESWAGPLLAGEMYQRLFEPNACLDEVVRHARNAVVRKRNEGEGERAWINPVVYSRYRNGRVFTFASAPPAELRSVEDRAVLVRKHVTALMQDDGAPGARSALRVMLDSLDELADQRATMVGNCIRIDSAHAAPGNVVTCSLRLRVADAGSINLAHFEVAHSGLVLSSVERGADTATDPIVNIGDSMSKITIIDPTGPAPSLAGERELVRLAFTAAGGAPRVHADVRVNAHTVQRSGQRLACHTVDGVVCIV